VPEFRLCKATCDQLFWCELLDSNRIRRC